MKIMLLVITIVYGLPIIYAITEDEQLFLDIFAGAYPRKTDWSGLDLNQLCTGDLYDRLANIEINKTYYLILIKVCCSEGKVFGMVGVGLGELFYLKEQKFNPKNIYEIGIFTVDHIVTKTLSDDYLVSQLQPWEEGSYIQNPFISFS